MESLAVKYRPKHFEDVLGQSIVVDILKKQLETNTFKNSYLFYGPSGCGKTPLAKIFANEINKGIGNPIEIDAASNSGVDNVRDIIFNGFAFLKWPILFIVTYILLKLLYALAPDTKVSSKTVTKGALFTTIGWMLVTALYSYYANNLANYSVFYGSLANLIILMVWIYIISYILVIGIAINVSDYKE